MILGRNKFRHLWNILMLLVISYTALEAPLRLVMELPPSIWLNLADLVTTVLFSIDIVLNFRFSILHHGKWVNDRETIANDYLKGWFGWDLLAAAPLELVCAFLLPASGFGSLIRVLHLGRLIKLARIFYYRNYFEYFLNVNFSIFRLVFFTYIIGLISHWVACGWYYLTVVTQPPAEGYFSAYLHTLYWCITTLTTVGYGDITPDGNLEKIYTMIVMILGVGVYGYVIGNVANIISSLDVGKSQHQARVEKINAFMVDHKFSSSLQRRVKNYFSYLWETRRGYDHASVFADLPDNFKVEFALQINKDIIERVPLFRGADRNLIKDIVLVLKPFIYLPGDLICTFGEIGDNMFFINKGVVEVVGPNGQDVYNTLTAGGFFGEVALLMSTPRNASVRAVDYCELYSLDKKDFDRVINNYPEFAKQIEAEARQRM